jgi:hypothetical protein
LPSSLAPFTSSASSFASDSRRGEPSAVESAFQYCLVELDPARGVSLRDERDARKRVAVGDRAVVVVEVPVRRHEETHRQGRELPDQGDVGSRARGQVAGIDDEEAGLADDHAGVAVRPFVRRVLVQDHIGVAGQPLHARAVVRRDGLEGCGGERRRGKGRCRLRPAARRPRAVKWT